MKKCLKMTKKIALVDYIGNCDMNGEVTGHAVKTLRETEEMLRDSFDVSFIITSPYIKYFDENNIEFILSYMSSPQMQNSILKKIKLSILKIHSIHEIIKQEDKIWFVNTDFWLYVGLLISKKKKGQKIYATNYLDFYYKKNIKTLIYNFAVKKIDCVFHTNANVIKKNHQFIPDYWFDSSIYSPFLKESKKNDVYFCGGINPGKDIIGAINAFNLNRQPLVIYGKFSDIEEYNKAVDIAYKNIEIRNLRLDDKSYYRELARHKFVLLPYKKDYYINRSSGVVLEAIFLGAIVIGPKFLLEQLGVEGIEYTNIEELSSFKISNIDKNLIEKISLKNKKLIKQYSYENVKKTYLKWLEGN